MLSLDELSSLQSLLPYASAPEVKRIEELIARDSPGGLAAVSTAGKQSNPPHLRLLDRYLIDVAEGRCPRLIISMPPRHGKSERTSRFCPGWFLGNWPDKRVILCSYAADFAAEWGRKARDLLEERGRDIFGIGIRPDSSAADRWDIEGHDGGMRTAGVGGPITGKGADLLIVDDPIKNAEEANSPTIREKHKDWWRTTAYTRLEPGSAAIVMCTRWHEDDLPGWLIKEGLTNGEPWTVLNLPGLAEENDPLGRRPGEALWPERCPVPRLNAIQKVVGPYWFAAMFQGGPRPAEGNRFKRPWFRYFKRDAVEDLYVLLNRDGSRYQTVKVSDCRHFATADLAFSKRKSADFTALGVWAVTPDSDLLLVEVIHDRLSEPEFLRAARGVFLRYRLDYLAVEAVGAQLGVVQMLRVGGLGDDGAYYYGLPVRAINVSTDKVTRAGTAIVRMEAGQVFLPLGAPWLDRYETELLGFDTAPHDDLVDMTSIAATEVFYTGGSGKSSEDQQAFDDAIRKELERKAREEYQSPDNDHWWS